VFRHNIFWISSFFLDKKGPKNQVSLKRLPRHRSLPGLHAFLTGWGSFILVSCWYQWKESNLKFSSGSSG